MSRWLNSGTGASHDEHRTGSMSQQAFGHAPQLEAFALRQVTSSDRQEFVTIGFDVFHNGFDDVAHLHLRHDRESSLDEIMTSVVEDPTCFVNVPFTLWVRLALLPSPDSHREISE